MRKSYRQDPQNNHERWLVSYADFITLLFAFFVVMYSLSSVNEGKYRVLSDSLGAAFKMVKPVELTTRDVPAIPTPHLIYRADIPDAKHSMVLLGDSGAEEMQLEESVEDDSFSQQVLRQAEGEIDKLGDEVENNFSELVEDDLISVKRNKFWLEVEIKSKLLFPSGSSKLLDEALPILQNLSKMFIDKPNRIHIEGFTDNVPINTRAFPSNWELSAARAATVVRLFETNGVDPKRMASIGYGEHQPIAENLTEQGRARNRRVVMVVMAAIDGRRDKRIYEFDALQLQPAE